MPQPATPALEFPTLTPVGRQAGAPTVLLTQPCTIAGSSSRASLRLEAKSVSRFHCLIVRSGRDVIVRDLASRNGTYVNKNKITERTLHGGDIIHIGDCPFQFRRRGTRDLPQPPLPPTSKLAGDNWPGVDISGKTLLIGRRDGCDVLLDSDDVAPAHAIVFAMDGAHHLLDLHSSTGTRLNGAAIKTATKLSPGDEIEVAGSVMRYEPLGVRTSKKDAMEDSDALIPIDFDEEDESPVPASAPAPTSAAAAPPIAPAPSPAAETPEPAQEEVEEEPFSLADLRDLGGIPVEPAADETPLTEPAPVVDEAPIPLADEEPAPIPPTRDEANSNPIIEESPAPFAEEPAIPIAGDLEPASTARDAGVSPAILQANAGEMPASRPVESETVAEAEALAVAESSPEIPPTAEPPPFPLREDLGQDIDDLALDALNESPTEAVEAPPAIETEAPPEIAPAAPDVPAPADEILPSSPFEIPEPAAESPSQSDEIHATINAPSAPSEESLTQALTADAAMDAVLPLDLPEMRSEAAAIADAEEETILENDGAVSADAEIPHAASEEPASELPVGEPPAPAAVEIDLNDFNSLIDSLGQAPLGVPVSHAEAPPPAVTPLSSTEIARAIRADVGTTAYPPPKPIVTDRTIPLFAGPGPATHGKVTVGFEISSPPARQEDVFAVSAKDSIWRVPPDPGFGVSSPGTVAGAASSRPIPEPPKQKLDPHRKAPEPEQPVAPRRAKRLWIFILLIGAAVVFWSQQRWHSAGELPPAQTPAQNDAERASMRQVPE